MCICSHLRLANGNTVSTRRFLAVRKMSLMKTLAKFVGPPNFKSMCQDERMAHQPLLQSVGWEANIFLWPIAVGTFSFKAFETREVWFSGIFYISPASRREWLAIVKDVRLIQIAGDVSKVSSRVIMTEKPFYIRIEFSHTIPSDEQFLAALHSICVLENGCSCFLSASVDVHQLSRGSKPQTQMWRNRT